MQKIFISYRRKEAADFTGRLFDRLSGYFGKDAVYMDVDVLIAGKDYRQQISEIIDQCDVLLAIIGEQWSDITDEAGSRRLDNPEDQLRIEIESALELGKAVIPLLIHDAKLPQLAQLPASLAALASQNPIVVQSGLAFNTDIKKLIDQLERDFGIQNPDRRFPLELILIPLGIFLLVVGVSFGLASLPYSSNYIQSKLNPNLVDPNREYTLATYRQELWNTLLFCTIPLALGSPLIVAGKRWCCVTKETRSRLSHFATGVGRRRPPKSSRAVYCLALGLSSLALGVPLSVLAFVFGILAMIETSRRRGWVRGRSLAVVGMILATVGCSVTFFLHVPFWKFDQWLQQMQSAELALETGDNEAAVAAFQAASTSYGSDALASALPLLRRAEIFFETQRYQEAIDDLSQVVEVVKLPQDQGVHFTEENLLTQAHQLRQRAYEAIGDNAKADEDRRALESIRSPDIPPSSIFDFENSFPDAPAAPLPPAPVVDPSA